MRITDIREFTLHTGEKRSNAVMDFSDMTTGFVAVITDVIRDGKLLSAMASVAPDDTAKNAICRERLIPRLLAAKPEDLVNEAGDNFDPFRVWDCMMQKEKPGGHGDRAIAVATIDMAIWDAAAKIAEEPLHTFLSKRYGTGQVPDEVFVYVGGGYYTEGNGYSALQDEMRRYLDDGFTVIKIKGAGAPLDEDLRRIEAVLEVLPANQLAIDANGRFRLEDAVTFAKAIQPYGLRWLEEPGYPLDYDLQAEIARIYDGPLATGECLLSSWDAMNLLRYGGLRQDRDILQFDCALSYGICEYIRTIAIMEKMGWSRDSLYPHGGHLLSLHITAGLGLGGTEVYPYTHQPIGGFTDGLQITNGRVALPQLSGLGFEGKANLKQVLEGMV